jgi:hypothetical protein
MLSVQCPDSISAGRTFWKPLPALSVLFLPLCFSASHFHVSSWVIADPGTLENAPSVQWGRLPLPHLEILTLGLFHEQWALLSALPAWGSWDPESACYGGPSAQVSHFWWRVNHIGPTAPKRAVI